MTILKSLMQCKLEGFALGLCTAQFDETTDVLFWHHWSLSPVMSEKDVGVQVLKGYRDKNGDLYLKH